jgi:PAS domain S-box-containing protein
LKIELPGSTLHSLEIIWGVVPAISWGVTPAGWRSAALIELVLQRIVAAMAIVEGLLITMLPVRHQKHARRSTSVEAEAALKDQLLCQLEIQQTLHLAKIQELEKVRAELESARDAFAALYEQSPVGYLTLDSRGNIHNVNAATLSLLGYTRKRILHLPISFLVYKPDFGKVWRHITQCEKAGQARVTTELRLLTLGQKTIAAQLISVPFASNTGRKLFLTAIVDLSERVRNEQQLHEAKEFAEAIVETVRHPMVVLDSELRVVSSNPAFTEYFKRPQKHVKGLVFEVLLNLWWSGNQLRDMLEKVLVKNQPVDRFLLAVELPGLGRRVFHLSARPLRQRRSTPDRILVILEDISDQELAREQMRKMNDELEQRVAARTDALRRSYEQMESFCYSIAHDLRAPLRSMSGFSELLARELGADLCPVAKDYAARIQQSAERMDNLINDLLQYGRLNTIDLPVQEVDLEKVFSDVRVQLASEIESRQAQVIKKTPLPRVFGNRVVLQVALANLLSNAIKFVPPETRPKVVIRTESQETYLRLWIEDNGIGIAPENHEKIFGVFQRLHKQDSYPGTGIGLALVAKGIERIGGRLGVESAVGQGSKFWIELRQFTPDAPAPGVARRLP